MVDVSSAVVGALKVFFGLVQSSDSESERDVCRVSRWKFSRLYDKGVDCMDECDSTENRSVRRRSEPGVRR